MNTAAWRLANLIFFYTCVEGLIVNIWYPSLLAYVYKDIMILALYLLVFLLNPERIFTPSPTLNRLVLPLLSFFVVIGAYAVLPGISPLGALVALKQRLFYIPLIGIAYFVIRSEEDVGRLSLTLMIFSVGVSVFGMYLFFRGPAGLLEFGANYSAIFYTPSGTGTQGHWRVPGTFTSPGQYGAYLWFNGLLAIGLLMTGVGSRRWKSITALSLILIILAMLTSGSRGPLVLLSASAAFLILVSRQPKRIVAWGLGAYVVFAGAFAYLGEDVKGRVATIADYQHVERLKNTYLGELFIPILAEQPLGSGLGVATVAARHFSKDRDVLLVESYFGILAAETGLLGLGSFIWAAIAVASLVLRTRTQIRGSPQTVLWYALATYVLFTIIAFPVSTGIDNAPTNLYFWFSIGMLAKMADLERRKTMAGKAIPGGPAGATWGAGSPQARFPWKPVTP